ncbi:hypothetical protein O3P69_010217 [Scylla paramamosain]|uniref:PHD-type domain-containing protein n=1 Tax=Scylla paramamosain TaxID=85552 RepID=A0AAW0TRG9_SCYPA
MRRCLEAGLSTNSASSSQAPDAGELLCHTCKQVNYLKQTISCSQCDHTHHLTSIGITQTQDAQLPTWHCGACLQYRPSTHRRRIASNLAGAITDALVQRSPLAWWRLLSFAYKSPLAKTADPSSPKETDFHTSTKAASETDEDSLSKRVIRKCADGDIRASLRLLTTSDCIALPTEEIIDALHARHHPQSLSIVEDDVLAAIKATPPGSVALLDGIRPLHLSQLVVGQPRRRAASCLVR